MWFRNRLVNPLVRLLLRSPLHRLLSRSLVILSYQGRKTGRWHSLPCMYARHGQHLYIIPGHPDRKLWWRNLRQPTPVRLRLQGRDLNGTATASSDPEAVAAGLRRYLARYPKTARPLGVQLETNGAVTAGRSLVVVTVHLDRS
jgi:nitroimidazol reductase NimA-like FMN-containing flavoprotein (pyridoxamine 5'-phosphate oxidase superfamily)